MAASDIFAKTWVYRYNCMYVTTTYIEVKLYHSTTQPVIDKVTESNQVHGTRCTHGTSISVLRNFFYVCDI